MLAHAVGLALAAAGSTRRAPGTLGVLRHASCHLPCALSRATSSELPFYIPLRSMAQDDRDSRRSRLSLVAQLRRARCAVHMLRDAAGRDTAQRRDWVALSCLVRAMPRVSCRTKPCGSLQMGGFVVIFDGDLSLVSVLHCVILENVIHSRGLNGIPYYLGSRRITRFTV